MILSSKYRFLGLILAFVIISFSSYSNEKIRAVTAGFIENKGQIVDQNGRPNTDVLFMYSGSGMKIQLRKNGYSYELFEVENLPKLKFGANMSDNVAELLNTRVKTQRIDVDFQNNNSSFEVITSYETGAFSNYLINGIDTKNVKAYNKITYNNIYPFTDIEFLINESPASLFKYNIVLHEGADLNKVKFLIKGANSIQKTNDNSITISTHLGNLVEAIPFSYYLESPSENRKIDFELNKDVLSFSGKYNKNKTFVIDPSSNRIWGTYFGGSALEFCTSNGIDASNNIYMAGYSLSTANIATSGAYQTVSNGSYDAYLSKFNSNGVQLWGTYFGGSGFDVAYAIHVLSNGVVYLTGDTNSPSNVASVGAHQTVYGGGIDDAILVKFDASGQRLWSTYMGGTMHDISSAVTVDSNGDVIISGHSESTNAIATTGAYNTTYGLNYDVFITKFNANGVRQWGTYYGDTGVDETYGMDCDASNNIYITGYTTSMFSISTGGAYQLMNGGNFDVFIAKFNPTGTNLIWGTYFGGSGDERGTALKVDNSNSTIFIGGNTTSSGNISSSGAYQTSIGSADDGFLAAFSFSGNRLWSTYFGGNDVDYVNALTLDANKNIFVCGHTLSTNAISTPFAYQPNLSQVNFYDAYFAKFSPLGKLKLATYFGGQDNETANGISIDNTGLVYLSGETSSTSSISTMGSHMSTYAGGSDAYLAKFCVAPEPTITSSASNTLCVNTNYTLSTQTGFATYNWNVGPTAYTMAVNTGSVAGNFYYTVNVTDGLGCDGTSDSLKVIVNLCLAVDASAEMASVTVYPVPAKNEIWITSDNQNKIIQIISTSGQVVMQIESSQPEVSFDISSLSSGMYFLKIESSQSLLYKKIIIN